MQPDDKFTEFGETVQALFTVMRELQALEAAVMATLVKITQPERPTLTEDQREGHYMHGTSTPPARTGSFAALPGNGQTRKTTDG